jgi:superfamily II DNA or RNA helicase
MAPGPLLEDPNFRPTGYDVLDETLAELEVASTKGRKLVIATWYRNTSNAVYEYLNHDRSGLWPGAAAMVIGGLTDRQREAALDKFTNDERCRVLIVQPGAAGKGVDGLQRFCHDMLFIEIPPTSIDFQQLVGRLDRTGQTMPVNIRVAVAEKTVQMRLWANALTKDEMANRVQRSFKDLRELVYGR